MAFVTVCVNESLMGRKGRRGQCLQLPAAATYSADVCRFHARNRDCGERGLCQDRNARAA